MNCFEDTTCLEILEADCWRMLQDAESNKDNGWWLPILGTVQAGTPAQRTVVLRTADQQKRQIAFHTDLRSAKVRQIQVQPNVSALFYDADRKAQLSLLGTARIHRDDVIADQMWQSESESSLKTYLAPDPPATVHAEPVHNLPPQFVSEVPSREQLQPGRKHFAAVTCQAATLDLLLLRPDGHIRCRFNYDVAPISRTWITP